jgi:hypothetical protein
MHPRAVAAPLRRRPPPPPPPPAKYEHLYSRNDKSNLPEEDTFTSFLREYNDDGRWSVRDVVDVCALYRGEHRHLLWEPSRRFFDGFYVTHCLDILCEEKLIELLKALIKDDPDFPLLRQAAAQEDSRCFFHEALWAASLGARKRRFDAASAAYAGVSSHVILLLAVSGATGPVNATDGSAPLVQACAIDGIHPDLIHRMIDYDPDALVRVCRFTGRLPIHSALEWNPTASFVPRMIELRPETLLAVDRQGLTPVMGAIQSPKLRCCTSAHAPPLAAAVAAALVLADLVATFPKSVRLSTLNSRSFDNALVDACQNFSTSPGLVKAVVAACPVALCVPNSTWGYQWMLPFEAFPGWCAAESPAGRELAAFIEDETLNLTLAAVEHALGDAVHERHPATAFRARVREIASALFPATTTTTRPHKEGRSGYDAAQALRELPDRTEVCRTLFHHRQTAVNLYHEDFRTFTLDNPVVHGLCRLNRMGGRSDQSAIHQVRLLEAVKDDLTCLYVQLRECGAAHVLLRCRAATQEGIAH